MNKNFISMYFTLDDFCIDMPDGGLRKDLDVQHTWKAQLKLSYVVFDGVNVV